MGKAFCLTFANWSEKRELIERRGKVSIFLEQEEKLCSTQIKGNDSNKEGMEIEEKAAAFIDGPYSTVSEAAGMIFKTYFWAQVSRKKTGHRSRGPYHPYSSSVESVHWHRNRGRKQKNRVWFLLLDTQIETKIYLRSWDKLVWYFMCIVVNDKIFLKNKNTLSLTGFPLVGFSRAIWMKFLSSVCVNEVLNIYFLSVKDLIYNSVLS